MSLTSSLSIATGALSAAQSAISVVSNNIANVNNEDYSLQSVHFADNTNSVNSSNNATETADSMSGVTLESISRSSDEYLSSYYRTENSNSYYYSTSESIATSVEDVTNELNDTSSGLSASLSSFYSAVSSLANDPTDVSLRETYVSDAQTVCQYFNNSSDNLENIEDNLVGNYQQNGDCQNSEISTDVSNVNSLFDQLANVNKTIKDTNSSTTSNSALVDTRDSILKQLSQYTNISTTIKDDNTASVSIGNYTLVSGSNVKGYLQVETGSGESDPVSINIVKDAKSTTSANVIKSDVGDSITSGTIGAILDLTCSSRDSSLCISKVVDKLNNLASTFASTMNSLQTGSTTTSGTTTYAMCLNSDYTSTAYSTTTMFVNKYAATDTTATSTVTAGNISVNSDITNNVYLIAAGRSSSTTASSNVGDTTNLTDITATKSKTNSALGNQTFSDYIATTDTSIGSAVSSFKSNSTNASTVLSSITTQLSSETGVNLDTELSKLIEYQQMYQAAAQVFSTCNSLMDTLLNMAS